MLGKLFNLVQYNLDIAKAVIYSALGSIFSVSILVMQSEFKPMYISSVSKLFFEGSDKTVFKSSSGFLNQVDGLGSELCTLKIILPFDNPPPAIPSVYLCSWDVYESDRLDSLCYTDFTCTAPDTLTRLYISASVLFLSCYIILGGLVVISRIKKPKWLSKRFWWAVVAVGGLAGMAGFCIGKTIPYITDSLISDVFDKIKSITKNKGGVADITYTETNYVLDTNSYISRTLIDIVSGFSVGFFFIIWEAYKKLFPVEAKQPCQL